MPANLATADPEPGGLPPVFTAICVVRTWNGIGTGFFVGERANVVTARHVVRKAESDKPPHNQPPAIVVCWVCTGRGFLFHAAAEIVREDPRTDVALLRLKNPEEFPRPLSLDSLTSLSPAPAKPGDFVYFDSFRHGPSEEFEIRRVLARVKRSDLVRDQGFEQRLLTLDARGWPGSSGSPVFSRAGEVIGVLTHGHHVTEQAIVRDVPWIWELFASAGTTRRQQHAGVIPFPAPPSFAPYDKVRPAWWRRWLQRIASRPAAAAQVTKA